MVESQLSEGTNLKFPVLMQSTLFSQTLVVLFYGASEGTVVHAGNRMYSMGEHRTDFIMTSFSRFNGKVTLSNPQG